LSSKELVVRKGTKRDSKVLLDLIGALADFENLEPPSGEARRRIVRDIFDRRMATVFFALYGGKPAGYAVFFYTYSTFLARPTLYLEDIFVLEEYRRRGIGRALFMKCVGEAARHHCGRMEWAVLTWNRNAMDFYESLDAGRLEDWCIYRLTKDRLASLAQAGLNSRFTSDK